MSLRIAGGELRGRRLASPPPGVRPTGARMREAMFSIWQGRLAGTRLLDLFAGSGIVGLEALSRGAAHVTFVDASQQVIRHLERSVAELVPGRARVRRGRLPHQLLAWPAAPHDLVFADPPYAWEEWPALLAAAETWLSASGELAVEHSVRAPPPAAADGLVRFDQRAWGESAVSRYRRVE